MINLACKDLFKDTGRARVLTDVINALKVVRNTHSLNAYMVQNHHGRPKLPAETRWGTTLSALVYYNSKWAYLAQVCYYI